MKLRHVCDYCGKPVEDPVVFPVKICMENREYDVCHFEVHRDTPAACMEHMMKTLKDMVDIGIAPCQLKWTLDHFTVQRH